MNYVYSLKNLAFKRCKYSTMFESSSRGKLGGLYPGLKGTGRVHTMAKKKLVPLAVQLHWTDVARRAVYLLSFINQLPTWTLGNLVVIVGHLVHTLQS